MRRSTVGLAISLTLVFLSGVLVGAFGYRLCTAEAAGAKTSRLTPEDYRRRFVDVMKTRLGLTEDQLQKLNAILDETGRRYREMDSRVKPEREAIHQQQTQDIMNILTEEQRAEYELMRQERAERRKGSEKGKGPPRRGKRGPDF